MVIGAMARTFLPRAYREMLGMSKAVTESGLDATVVRFIAPAPADGPAAGVRKVGFFGTDRIGWKVTRADIAAFTAAQVDGDRYVGAAPAIGTDLPGGRRPVGDYGCMPIELASIGQELCRSSCQ
ncbi:hypothetical protein SAMN05444580_102185 [Rhodococcus tukisamuensis]|uniref:Uncharacterized protein n=1 Tax=Rhodococcus tukisamuensis TaxID=168276 RepID=A0A1G6QRZ7_9NOCA|nr:hypothetical protein SAMN05444580_102185 [Rhodococcus tukisamuensis]